MAKAKLVDIIVRRGAVERFNALSRKTADMPVEVAWDRRKNNRRQSNASTPLDRRKNDRRKAPPFTWEAADFVVVTPQPKRRARR